VNFELLIKGNEVTGLIELIELIELSFQPSQPNKLNQPIWIFSPFSFEHF
jgi:hypothetical protein